MKNTKEGGSSAATSNRAGGGGKGHRRKNVDSFAHNEKENVDIFAAQGNLRPNETKSPLPIGYPRFPLQDITAVLELSNNIPGEENGSSSNKPNTRAQVARKTEIVQTTVLTEKIVKKNASRAGASTNKTRQRKSVLEVFTSDDSATQGGESAQLKEAIRLTVSLATSVQLKQQQSTEDVIRTEESAEGEISVKETAECSREEVIIKNPGDPAREEISVKEAAEVNDDEAQRLQKGDVVVPMEVAEPPRRAEVGGRDRARERPGHKSTATSSNSGPRNEDTRDQKRRKPLSARSSVSSFR